MGNLFEDHVAWLRNGNHGTWKESKIFLLNWGVQFVCSWLAFGTYMVWDYRNYKSGQLLKSKLPSRHPMVPFWWSQIRMLPVVLYNQLVVWPLTFLLLCWPTWVRNDRTGSMGWVEGTITFFICMFISDAMWYWSHRLMHTKWCWANLHKLHHIAENTAISATYVHAIEYMMFTVAMNLPWALSGFPYWIHLIPMGWGMFTGAGAHSGYSGDFANGDEHNAHHYFHTVNFGLLMLNDRIFGTHWQPGKPPPKRWAEADVIFSEFPSVTGTSTVSKHGEYEQLIASVPGKKVD